MDSTVVKKESLVAPKREHTADDPSFVEEELQIFTKRPRIISRRKGKKNGDVAEKTPAEGLEAVPKAESDPGCSFSSANYPAVENNSGPQKPKLNYRQLAFLAMKNANYIPMQTQQICDFVERVFPHFSQMEERMKNVWRNALSGAVRTGKCDEGLFTTNSVTGSGLRMFYGMRKDRIDSMETQVARWKCQFSASNIKQSGLSSTEELNAICNGTKGINFVIKDMGEHVEKWKKSQLSGATLEDYDEKERQLMTRTNEIDDDELTLTREEEKALARKAKKNATVECPVCDMKMNSKSFGRHMKLIHRLTQEDLLRHRLEMQTQKMDRLAGNDEPQPIVCKDCGKQFLSSVMREAHDSVCDGSEFPEVDYKKTERMAASQEEPSEDDKYADIVHL